MERRHPSLYSFPMLAMSSPSLGSRNVPWWGEGFSTPPTSYPALCCSRPDRVTSLIVQVISPTLVWPPVPSVLVVKDDRCTSRITTWRPYDKKSRQSIYMHAGHCSKTTYRQRFIPVKEIASTIWQDVSLCLLTTLTCYISGCDTTSSLFNVWIEGNSCQSLNLLYYNYVCKRETYASLYPPTLWYLSTIHNMRQLI